MSHSDTAAHVHAAALRMAGVGVWELNPDDGRLEASAETCQILGFAPQAAAQSLHWSLLRQCVHPHDLEAFDAALSGALRAGSRYEATYRVRVRDGDICVVHSVGEVDRDDHGNVRRMIGILQDVTAMRRPQDPLPDPESRYRSVVEEQTDFIVRWLPDGTRTFVNDAYLRYFGLRRDEVIGTTFFALIVTETERDVVRRRLRSLTPADPFMSNVHRARRADGEWRWQEWTDRGIFDDEGSLVEVHSVGRDVHDRAVAEERVRAAERRLQHVIGSSPVVLFTLSVAGNRIDKVAWVSRNLERLLGFSADAGTLDADWWVRHLHPDDRAETLGRLLSDVLTHEQFTVERRVRHNDGSYRWIRCETRLLRDDEGRPSEVVGSLTDVTEQRRLEDQFRQAQKMEAVGHFAGGLAHDFNNLMTIVCWCCEELLAAADTTAEQRELLSEIREAGQRATGLTRRLLAFARQSLLEPRVLDVNDMIRENERMLRLLASEEMEVVVELSEGLRPVKVDPGQLVQVLINLVVNARDAMKGSGRLTIVTSEVTVPVGSASFGAEAKPGRYVAIAVADTGVGMTAEVRKRIFEPFFTTKGPGKGTGLGLPTVHGIVQQSGGFVRVQSEPGHGSTFTICLPVADGGRLPADSPARPAAMALGTETILVVEDESAVRSMLARILRRAGYAVIEAGRGAEALRLVDQHPGAIHLVIADVVMPGMGGRELVDQLARLRPDVRVLYISGYTDDAVVRHGVQQADVAFLQKPFSTEAVTDKVREVLDASTGGGAG